MNFRYLFRSTAILARITAILAEHVATQAGAPETNGQEGEQRQGSSANWPNPDATR